MGELKVKLPRRNSYHSMKHITMNHDDFRTIEVGNSFHADDSTSDIGAETTPAGVIHLYFTTPATKEIIVSFSAFCSTAASVCTIREGWSAGGGASGDSVTAHCLNRGTRKKTSALTILTQADAVTSGGTILHQETLAAGSIWGGDLSETHPWCLAASTNYSIEVKLNGAGVARVGMHWYERVLKA